MYYVLKTKIPDAGERLVAYEITLPIEELEKLDSSFWDDDHALNVYGSIIAVKHINTHGVGPWINPTSRGVIDHKVATMLDKLLLEESKETHLTG